MDTTVGAILRRFRQLLLGLPWDGVPRSFIVDLLQFCASSKRVIRTRIVEGGRTTVAEWANQNLLHLYVDSGDFAFVGVSMSELVRASSIDQSCEPHELEFGAVLGYPDCCCRFIATRTEAQIDDVGEEQKAWRFEGEFRLINPTGYSQGRALISHLPCSTNCKPSSDLAWKAVRLLEEEFELPANPLEWSSVVFREYGQP